MEVWQGRRLPTVPPVCCRGDCLEAARNADRSRNPVARQYAPLPVGRTDAPLRRYGRRYSAAGCSLGLYTLGPPVLGGAQTRFWTSGWRSTTLTLPRPTLPKSWDCDNYATALCARASEHPRQLLRRGGRLQRKPARVQRLRRHPRCTARLPSDSWNRRTTHTVDLGDRIGEHEAYVGQAGVHPLAVTWQSGVLSAFGWYGGKVSHLEFLLPLLPEDAYTFVDLYGGSARP